MELADPNFNKPGHVDILLGAEVAASLMLSGKVEGPVGCPVAQNTKFGWMLSGSVHNPSSNHYVQVSSHHASCNVKESCMESSLQKFWELEESGVHQVPQTIEDKDCESHFVSTHKRNQDGTYTVELPFKENFLGLGSSKDLAMKRYKQIELRMSRNSKIKDEYIKTMREAIKSNHMEVVPQEALNDHDVYYMPHHIVIKEESSTTPYRVVYDASAKTSNGMSLNDVLMRGPKLQEDLISLLIRFRVHQIAMAADIAKMYTQTKVSRKHIDFQRLFWRESEDLPIKEYRLLRVTFGVKSAPFLGVRCLHQLAEDESKSFPQAAKIIKEDFVVDNLLSGADDLESALKLQDELMQIMKRGGLNLRKWTSNCDHLLQNIPIEKREELSTKRIDQDDTVKTIGLLWNPANDTFSISIKSPDPDANSKRTVLSCIAKVFDPLGWLAPVTITPKILMQKFWKDKLDWDSPLPHHYKNQWANYCEDLKRLSSITINRCITGRANGPNETLKYELHGFCDASSVAYAACVYFRSVNCTGKIDVELVAAKTRVAPIKRETIPRLELCGAVLLSKLIKTVTVDNCPGLALIDK